MIVVISPTKTQDFSEHDLGDVSQLRQTKETFELINILKQYSQNDIKSLMKISDNLSSLNYDRFQGLSTVVLIGTTSSLFKTNSGFSVKKQLIYFY